MIKLILLLIVSSNIYANINECFINKRLDRAIINKLLSNNTFLKKITFKNKVYMLDCSRKKIIQRYNNCINRYSLKGELLISGKVDKNFQPIGKWYYKENKKVKIKDFNKPYKFSRKQVENLALSLKEKPFYIFKMSETPFNVWLVRFLNMELFIDGDNGKIIYLDYKINFDKDGNKIPDSIFYKYKRCIIQNIYKRKTLKQIGIICNIDTESFITEDSCLNYDHILKEIRRFYLESYAYDIEIIDYH